MVREADHAERGRDRHLGARQGDLGERRPDALGDLEGRGNPGVGEQDRELLPAVAPGEVPGPQRAPQHRADVGENLVPHRMTPLVIDALEVVEVDQQQPQRRRRCGGLGEQALHRVRDRTLVGQPGQAVGRRADLRHGQVAQVREDRGRLAD